MLDDTARITNYFVQTGRGQLTAPQRRRVKHKRNHQSADAAFARESRSAAARALSAARRVRRAAYLPAV
ncbi:hypothetical protein [Nonomuraea sp. KM90]|uniref:hypothetical protein n=1 Tax=Nonomuraea sp. KM90 TaxID=3457428 RepID=UPI003FCDE837